MSSRISDIPRLEKLVLMLSSNSPGEVAAAAAAIGRALKAADADWHDLARELTKEPAPPAHDGRRNRNGSDAGDDWRPLHQFCRQHPGELSGREVDFMSTLDHWRGDITEKQRAWLIAIHGRLRRGSD